MFYAIALLFTGIIYFTSCKVKVKAPDRLATIPDKAVWVGGADGGNWYELSKVVSNNTFKIKIYNDFSGDTIIDTTFVLNPDCLLKEIDSLTLIKNFNFFDGSKVELLLPAQGKRCSLIIK